ncbi:hypothetical protein [Kineococcus aurantiacus]|uniref:Uncharacterized protein n=1 Tax=Kineococcus aurantiacus TaxID=37633 RepID=A0A7Y9DL46_9ACTN|nr:hypothetical protein [Kineococcus aurantiacus]NYD22601.1 hypothetical protein [Kineococcus aurantiacus]
MHPSDGQRSNSFFLPPTRRWPLLGQIGWWVLAALVGGVCGYAFVSASGWAGSEVPVGTVVGGGAAVAVVSVVAHLGIHPWWGPALVWAAFVVGTLPPLALEDALWLVAAAVLGGLVAGYVAVVNLGVLAVRALVRRRGWAESR